jgi:hypothetical protein
MQEALVDGELASAGPDSPEEAICPSCGGPVKKRKRRRMDGQTAYFYRHDMRVGEECPLRYRP